jgi:zinc transport system ATP-binding protein
MSESRSTLIRAEGLNLRFKGRTVLDNISLTLEAGRIVSLIGPNGAGKTALVKLMLGLMPPTSGTVARKPDLVISYLPQRAALEPMMPMTVARFLALGSEQRDKTVTEALEEAGIARLRHTPMQSVSGGELQRVMLARCLLRDPELLVLDEPDQGMDAAGQQSLYELIAGIRERYRCGVLMVSHNLHLVMDKTDRVICLNRHVCCTGHPEAISRHPEFLQLFGQPVQGLAVYSHDHDHEHDLHGNVIHE